MVEALEAFLKTPPLFKKKTRVKTAKRVKKNNRI